MHQNRPSLSRWLALAAAAGCLFAASCSTARTQRTARGASEHVMTASAETESAAYAAAVDEATLYCRHQGRSFRLVEQQLESGQVSMSFRCQ